MTTSSPFAIDPAIVMERLHIPNDKSISLYVAGFLFRKDGSEVALVKKNRPAWQVGMLNGIGGKVELNETVTQSMPREFREEATADINDWKPFCWLQGASGTWAVAMFVSHADIEVKTNNDEEINWYPVKDLDNLPVIPNLRWLIPMALDHKVEMSIMIEHDREG